MFKLIELQTFNVKLLSVLLIFVALVLAQATLPLHQFMGSASVTYAAVEEGGGNDDNFNIIPRSVCEGEAANSAACKTNVDGGTRNNSIYGQDGALTRIADFLAVVVGIAAVIAIIIGAFQYVLSGGDSSKVTTAKNTIIYALVGVVVTVLARQIIVYTLNQFT